MCVRQTDESRDLLAHTHTLALFLCAERSEGGGDRAGGKNEEEVLRAARLDPANAGLLMKHRSGHSIIQVTQVFMEKRSRQEQTTIADKKVSVHGNPDYSALPLCVSVGGNAVLAGV